MKKILLVLLLGAIIIAIRSKTIINPVPPSSPSPSRTPTTTPQKSPSVSKIPGTTVSLSPTATVTPGPRGTILPEPSIGSDVIISPEKTSTVHSFLTTIPGWTLMWNDEFNDANLNKTKWNVWDWASIKSNELEYYAPDEVWTQDGVLRIRSQKREYKGRQYTSGKLTTQHLFTQTYGRFEMRAKLPTGKGMWPAFWLNPIVGWPPEIDVFEVLGHKPDIVYMTNHFTTILGGATFKQGFYKGEDSSKDFHTYAVEWEPGIIRWYIDGVERFRSTQGVPNKPMYIIINNAVGGNWPGNPDDTTVFPQYYDIDYVRVYKKS